MFPGQGSQKVGMGGELFDEFSKECGLLGELISQCRDLGPSIFVIASDDVDCRFADFCNEFLNAYQYFLHELGNFGLLSAHETTV